MAGPMTPELEAPPPDIDQEDASESGGSAPKMRVYSKHILPSERFPFQLHFDVLKQFVIRTRNGQDAITSDKAEGNGIPVQAAQINVRFWKDIGLLATADRGRYLPTPETIKFVQARTVGEAHAKPLLRELLLKTWFGELAINQFRLEPLMAEDRFIGELALAAETDKSKKERALRVILDYLVYAGILNRDDRGLTLAVASPPSDGASPKEVSPVGQVVANPPRAVDGPSSPPPLTAATRIAPTPESRVLQSEFFFVRVNADVEAVQDLIDHLEILKKSIERKQAKNPQRPAEDGTSST